MALSGMPEVSVVGVSSSPCSFASSDMPSRCAKFAEAWPPVRENFVIWVCPRLRLAPLWPTPMNIGLGSYVAILDGDELALIHHVRPSSQVLNISLHPESH